MENIMDCIFARRSIRRYADKKVEREVIIDLLKAATAAPSAANRQPWEFVVVTKKETMDLFRGNLYNGNYNAPAAIVVCGNMDLAFSGPSKDYWIQDCSAAIENILLCATGLGLGGVWIGVHPVPSVVKPVSKILSLPEKVIPLGVVYIGYPAEEKEARCQYNEKRVYWEEYDSTRKHRARPKNLKELGSL